MKGIHKRGAARALALAVLLALALLLAWQLAGRQGPALADLLFQSPPTDTPDPNSPLPTPTPTDTPWPTDTPPAPEAPTNTPAPVEPTWTPAPEEPTATPEFVPPPPDTPTPTPFVDFVPPPVAPPIEPTESIQATDTPTSTAGTTVLLVRPIERQPSPEEGSSQRRLDPALFIDNLVVAAGYVWLCFGALGLLGGVIVGVLVFRRGRQPADIQPARGAQPVPPASASHPAGARATSQPPAPPPPAASRPTTPTPRVAARHRAAPPDDRDRPAD